MKTDRSTEGRSLGEDRLEARLSACRTPRPSPALRDRTLAAAGEVWRATPSAVSLCFDLCRAALALAAALILVAGTERWTAAPAPAKPRAAAARDRANAAFPQAFGAGAPRLRPTPEDLATYRRRLWELLESNHGENRS